MVYYSDTCVSSNERRNVAQSNRFRPFDRKPEPLLAALEEGRGRAEAREAEAEEADR